MEPDRALEAPSVVIADDHALSRALARKVLEVGGFVVCGEAVSSQAAVTEVLRHSPNVALLDIRMPGDGIRAAKQINLQAPGVAIVMLTVSRDSADIYEAILAGASGYVVKGTDTHRLPDILRGVLAGEASLPAALLHRMVNEFHSRHRNQRRLPGVEESILSEREWEVLELLAEGLSTAAIADRLFIAKVTVRSHIAAIVRKLRVDDRSSAAALLRSRRETG